MAGHLLVDHLDYSEFMRQCVAAHGVDLEAVFNCYDPDYDPDNGWPLKLPDVDFGPRTLLLLHLQDFVTSTDQGILELAKIQQHYGDRCDRVIVTHWPHDLGRHYHGPLNLIEFNSHEYTIVANISGGWPDLPELMQQPRNWAWQCLNGRRCNHRLRAAQILQHWPNGILSYGQEIALHQWPYETYAGTENEENFRRLVHVYAGCAVNIVTETQYDRAPGIITEKTAFAVLSQQIPIVIGYQGIVRDCQRLGLDMFADLVDLSYDDMPNDARVEQALHRNQSLIQGGIDLTAYQTRLQLQQKKAIEIYTSGQRQKFHTSINAVIRRLGWQ